MSIVLQGSTSGSITLQEPAIAGTTVLDLPATSGTVLVGGTQNIPKAALPTGSVLQVVQAVKTDTYAGVPGATWTDVTGLSVSITPTSSSSKILIIADVKAAGTSTNSIVRSLLLRNSTAIYVGDAASDRPRSLGQMYVGSGVDDTYYIGQIGGTYLDSPATTSSVTYKIQIGADGTTQTVYVNRTESDRNTAFYDSRVASSITVMEIAA